MSKGYHIFMDNFFMTVALAKDVHKLSTYVARTIRINRKFLLQAFQTKFEVGEKKIFSQGPNSCCCLSWKKVTTSSFAANPPTARQKILNTVCVADNNMLESLPLHRATIIVWGELTLLMLCCICILTKEEWGNTGRKCVSTFFQECF